MAINLCYRIKPSKIMLERIKYNFWLLVFIVNAIFFLFFLYQAISFTSLYAFRWLFFLSTPFFTSGIHLLIKSRTAKAEWLSVLNFILTAFLIVYFNALPDALENAWIWFSVPVFNQLYINTFDVIWSNQYRFKLVGVIAVSMLWVYSLVAILLDYSPLFLWFIPLSIVIGIIILVVLILGNNTSRTN